MSLLGIATSPAAGGIQVEGRGAVVMTVRLMIIDDHALVRRGLVQFLGSSQGIEVVAEAASGDELLEKLRTIQADLLLLDMSMPGENGANLIRHIRKLYPAMSIMVLSMLDDPGTVTGAIRAGASGYLFKNSSPQILLDAIHKIIETGKCLSHSLADRLLYAPVSSDPD